MIAANAGFAGVRRYGPPLGGEPIEVIMVGEADRTSVGSAANAGSAGVRHFGSPLEGEPSEIIMAREAGRISLGSAGERT